jgi:hypothetical protein
MASGSPVLVQPKKSCCKDKPRCKRCPVVCKRLCKAGLAEKTGCGSILLSPEVRKKDIRAARGA